MITIISGTNRANNLTSRVCEYYKKQLTENGESVQLFSLEELPSNFAFNNDVYSNADSKFSELVNQYIKGVDKLVIVSPEYNGSFPGVLKTFIDGVWPEMFRNKKVALVGVASGRAGNLRGNDHLTTIFHYLGVEVLSYKIAISGIDGLIAPDGDLADNKTKEVIIKQIQSFLKF